MGQKMLNLLEQKPSLKERIADGAKFGMKLSLYAVGIAGAIGFGCVGVKGIWRLFSWLWGLI